MGGLISLWKEREAWKMRWQFPLSQHAVRIVVSVLTGFVRMIDALLPHMQRALRIFIVFSVVEPF